MKKWIVALALVFLLALLSLPASADTDNDQACWGQASAVFARMGEMGDHASQQETPREGLANLARRLFAEEGVGDGSLQGLAAYLVSIDPNLTVEACM